MPTKKIDPKIDRDAVPVYLELDSRTLLRCTACQIPDAYVLQYIYAHKGSTLQDLAEAFVGSKQNIWLRVSRLRSSGYIYTTFARGVGEPNTRRFYSINPDVIVPVPWK